MPDIRESLQEALGSGHTIERELGGGAMSRVFVAHETALNRRVVVKVLLPELASGVSAQRFALEVHAAATLQHPHIVPVLSAGTIQHDIPYYIMPFVPGETLRERLLRGRIPFVESIALLGDVAKALAATHEAQLVHRDVKPDNILLSGGAAVVTDFGIAHAMHHARRDTVDANLTAVATSLGTPSYIAPEQAVGGEVDARTDVYAWGVITYEMLAGRHPFAAAKTAQQLIAAHIAERPTPVSHHVSDTPAWFCALVMSCLEKDPARRPANGSALVHAVEYGALEHQSATAKATARAAAGMRRLFHGGND